MESHQKPSQARSQSTGFVPGVTPDSSSPTTQHCPPHEGDAKQGHPPCNQCPHMGIKDMAQSGGQLPLLPAPYTQHTQDPKPNVLAMMDKQP